MNCKEQINIIIIYYQMFFSNFSKAASKSQNNYKKVFETNKNQVTVMNR